MGRSGMHVRYWWESQKERDNIKMDLGYDGVIWTSLIWLRVGASGGLL
jgi:hypothetical protein